MYACHCQGNDHFLQQFSFGRNSYRFSDQVVYVWFSIAQIAISNYFLFILTTILELDPSLKQTLTFNHNHTSQNSFYKWTKISSLRINIFDLKMMVKSGLEFFVLKFTEPLQRQLLSRQANSAILSRYFCTGQQQL